MPETAIALNQRILHFSQLKYVDAGNINRSKPTYIALFITEIREYIKSYSFKGSFFLLLLISYRQTKQQDGAGQSQICYLELYGPAEPFCVVYVCQTEADEKGGVCRVDHV